MLDGVPVPAPASLAGLEASRRRGYWSELDLMVSVPVRLTVT